MLILAMPACAVRCFITPNLFLETPDPGQSARLTPAARLTNLPLFLIQPELSTTALRGARVYWRAVPSVRDRFFFRPDAAMAEELAQAERLPSCGWRKGCNACCVNLSPLRGRVRRGRGRRFVAQHRLGFPILLDPAREVTKA
ncbi:MAG: hypothetical protein P3W87_007200 [Gammaproteobacteria bacterium]|nr:hypothetical protein [Gammaproteobacteria bacterium]